MKLGEVFANVIEEMTAQSQVDKDRVLTVDNIYQEGHPVNRKIMYPIVCDLLLPGSGIEGLEHFKRLGELADSGASCLILAEHLSNFDVPVFWTLAHRLGPEIEELFERIVFIAGRKLNEESALIKLFTEMFTRIVISPKTFLDKNLTPQEQARIESEAQAINMAAYRKIRELKTSGKIFLVYPTGTRFRPWEPSTGRGLREVEGYLRSFDHIAFLACQGNLMLPEQGKGMADESPRHDRVVLRFGPVMSSKDFRLAGLSAYQGLSPETRAGLDEKQYLVDLVMDGIRALHQDPATD